MYQKAMLKAITLFVFTVLMTVGVHAAEPGQHQICVGCHANNGNSLIPEYPKLNGQDKQYLIQALTEYRSGARQHQSMNLFSSNLSDQEIVDIAEFYSSVVD